MTNNNTNQPPYVAFYGMERDPFSPEVETDLFYAEPTRKQRLDVLLHLTDYGNELMIVIGPKGSGKTALLKQFQSRQQESWKVAPIEVKEGFDERKLLQQLYRQMDLAFRGASFNDLMDYMEKHFRQLQENSLLPVLLIDDAELLPVTALKKLLEMASLTNNENKPLIRVIMFGTEKIKEHFKLPQLGHLANLPMRSMELPPLSEEQTVHYILHRSLAAKFNSKEIFNEPAILKIYRESYGWPARINEICRDMLLKSVPSKKQEKPPGMGAKSHNPKQLIAAVVAIAVLVVVLIFQEQITSWVNRSSDVVASLSADNQQQATVTDSTQHIEQSETTASSQPTTLVEKLKSRDRTYQSLTNEEQNPAETEKTASPQPSDTPEPSTLATTKKLANPLNIQHGNDWLLSQVPGQYTLQLVAGESLKTIDDFIKNHQLKDNIALYESLRKGKPWRGLVYGIYENKQMAATAVEQLPPKLKRLKPWIRSLSGIQKDIHKLPVEKPAPQKSLVTQLSRPLTAAQTTADTINQKTSAEAAIEINRQEDWILKQRYNHYTLQLIADENIETIYRFINRHQLRDSIALYRSTQEDKTRHILIYGIYSNKQLATSGISRLPTSLQQANPSIRQFSNIHREINQVTP